MTVSNRHFRRLIPWLIYIPTFPVLDTDASDVAIGAVLSQIAGGVEKPIAFFSRVLNSTQRNYCSTRRELLAVIDR